MNLESLRKYCLSKKGASECFPFDEETLVFKVMDKMFCLTNLNPPFTFNLKCDPEKAMELRDRYEAVKPGYHMSKVHWNTIEVDGTIKDKLLCEWINDSYNLIVAGLSKKNQKLLEELE